MDHIDDMDQLRQGIGLQAYGQRDPLVEYKMTGYNMFGEMTNMIAETTIRTLFHIRVEQKVEREEVAKVTGTNKDDTSVRAPKKTCGEEDLSERSVARAEAERNTNSAAAESSLARTRRKPQFKP